MMIKNGLYSLIAVAIDGVDVEVGGVLMLRDGKLQGGDSYVFYTGTYACSDGKWKGEMISQEHTPTTRPTAEREMSRSLLNIAKRPLPRLTLRGVGLTSKDAVS
jgi:hypothetical protein